MDTARKVETLVDAHVSVAAAGRRLGKAQATIKSMALRGELDSELVAGRIVITIESIERYERARDAAR